MTRRTWTSIEDILLRKAVDTIGPRNWKAISEILEEKQVLRNHVQCSQRWLKVLQPGIKKGPWLPEEDAKLIELVQLEQNKSAGSSIQLKLDWAAIAHQIPGRISKNVRERWKRYIDPAIKKVPWSSEEDSALLQGHQRVGSKWTTIAQMDCLIGRTGEAIKTRWKKLQREKENSDNSESKQLQTPVKRPAPDSHSTIDTANTIDSDSTIEVEIRTSRKRSRLEQTSPIPPPPHFGTPKLPSILTVLDLLEVKPATLSGLSTPTQAISAESILDEWMSQELQDECCTKEDMRKRCERGIQMQKKTSMDIDSSIALSILSELGTLLQVDDLATGLTPKTRFQSQSRHHEAQQLCVCHVGVRS